MIVGWLLALLKNVWNNGETSTPQNNMFYAIELMVSMVISTNMLQYGWWSCKNRPGDFGHWARWSPVYFLLLSVPLYVGFPAALVFVYIGKVGYPGSELWHSRSWWPDTALGATLFGGRWLGVVFLTIAVLRITNLHSRIKQRWFELRGNHTKPMEQVPGDAMASSACCA